VNIRGDNYIPSGLSSWLFSYKIGEMVEVLGSKKLYPALGDSLGVLL